MERHLLWTLPDPAAALGAWRRAAPDGRLVLVESLWGRVDPLEKIRAKALRGLKRVARRAARPSRELLGVAALRRCLSPEVLHRRVSWRWWVRRVGDVLGSNGCVTSSGRSDVSCRFPSGSSAVAAIRRGRRLTPGRLY